ncbi:MAG: ATP-binding protein [Candidatus Krumholzibacteriia bacterium]
MLERHINQNILAALKDTPVVFLRGARQTGKSTLARALVSGPWRGRYLTLDDPAVLSAARSDPAGFVGGLEGPVVLDEVQRAPGLFLAIKAAVDRDRRPGRFLLTGSSDVLHLPSAAQALAGRMEILTLWPFSQGEIEGVAERFVDDAFEKRPLPAASSALGFRALLPRILQGGFPEMLGRRAPDRRRAWFDSYVTAILQRDVRDMAAIAGLSDLPRLLALLAARMGGIMSYAEISRALSMPATTLKRYIALLEGTFLVQMLPAWSGELGRRLVKAPKLILADTGLAASLLGIEGDRVEGEPTLVGRLMEDFVVMELCKQASWSETAPRLYHLRTHTGDEVDVIMEDQAGRLVGVEVKASASVSDGDFRGLRTFAAATGRRFVRGFVLYTGRESVPFAENLTAVPVASLWAKR